MKPFLLASCAAGVLVQAWLGAREWPPLLPLTAVAFAAGYLLVRRLPAWGWAPILVPAYVYPVIFFVTREFFTFAYYSIWFAAMLGAILASSSPRRWHLPRPWLLPLASWALVLAIGWPLIAARELDFASGTLSDSANANSGLGGPPAVVIVTMLVSMLPQLLGILWFDALFATFAAAGARTFRRAIVLPLAASLALASLLAVYQAAFDLTFLSGHQWPSSGRAAGGLMDGNALGGLAALWSAALLTLALRQRAIWLAAGLLLTAIVWLAVWATGSRMAMVATLVGLLFTGVAMVRGLRNRRGRLQFGAAVAALGVIGLVVATQWRSEFDPVTRTIDALPGASFDSVLKFVESDLWNRSGPFGTATVQMLKDSPVSGIGPGTFEVLYPDYAYVISKALYRSHIDNAQSWFRHHLAELGIAGSLGWITWFIVFGTFVIRRPATRGVSEATGVKAALVALVLISLVSMPTRNVLASLSFWVFAFWFVALTGQPERPRWLAAAADRRAAWIAVWLLAFVFAGFTAWMGYGKLRPPTRALMANWEYLAGVSRPVETPEGVVRYTSESGVAVFPALRDGYLKLGFQVAHPDAGSAPVRVKIYQSGEQVAHFVIGDRNWHEVYLKAPPTTPWLAHGMLLQVTVDRPAIGASVPARGLVLKDWEFVVLPPKGAILAQRPGER